MTYFNLRKRDPEPEPEPEPDEATAPEEEGTDEEPTGWPGAVAQGIRGPGAWLADRFGTGTAWAAHVGSLWAACFYGGWIAAGLVLAWVVAISLFVPRERLEQVASLVDRWDERRSPAEPTTEPPASGGREAVVQLLLDVMGDGSGVHLSAVLAHLQEHGHWEGRTVTDLRAHLARLGVPHDRRVKVRGVPTWGVRRRDLEAPSPSTTDEASPAPSPTV